MFDEVIHVTPLRFPIGDEIQQEDLPEDTDTAIYVIARQAGESADRRLEKAIIICRMWRKQISAPLLSTTKRFCW